MIPRHALLLALAASLAACGPTDDRIAEFAKQGVSFADLVPPAMDATLDGNARNAASILMDQRPSLTASQREAELDAKLRTLEERREILDGISRAAVLLGSYFRTLGQLAASDPGSGTETAINGIVDALAKLKIETGSADSISAFGGFVVGEIKSAKLRAALAAHGPVIYRTIGDIELALAQLQDAAELEQREALNDLAAQDVDLPYIGSGPLPADWPDRFARHVMASATPVAMTEARLAARELREAYQALARDTLSLDQIESLAARLAKLAGVVKL